MSSGGANFIMAKVSNLHHQRSPKLMYHCVQGARYPFSSSDHLAPNSFPIALLSVSNFPIASSKDKGPKIFHCAINDPWFFHHVIKMMISNLTSRNQGVPIHPCIIKGSALWPVIPHHVIKGSYLSLRHQGDPFPLSLHHRDLNFQNTLWDVYHRLRKPEYPLAPPPEKKYILIKVSLKGPKIMHI